MCVHVSYYDRHDICILTVRYSLKQGVSKSVWY